jgi:hypothetical protein
LKGFLQIESIKNDKGINKLSTALICSGSYRNYRKLFPDWRKEFYGRIPSGSIWPFKG